MFPTTALVTGGASGIGAAVVDVLRDQGCTVRVLDLADGFDVADPYAWAEIGPVELACLNAGVTTQERDIAQLRDDAYTRILGANVHGVVYGTRRMAQVMPAGGAIVVTASLAGLTPLPTDPIYSLTKHAVVGFVRSVAPSLKARGIRICAVAPGIVDTPLIATGRAELERANFPLLEAADVARTVLNMARDASTGEVWAVQPGREPESFRFSNVPGARDASGRSAGRPPAH